MNEIPLSKLIKEAREAKQWSQQKLAEQARLSIDTVRGIERGTNTNPTLFVLKALKYSLDVPIEI